MALTLSNSVGRPLNPNRYQLQDGGRLDGPLSRQEILHRHCLERVQ